MITFAQFKFEPIGFLPAAKFTGVWELVVGGADSGKTINSGIYDTFTIDTDTELESCRLLLR